ncbi:MAG TPA: ABC transporter permease subunit, partial [Allocoleopsis sp.]
MTTSAKLPSTTSTPNAFQTFWKKRGPDILPPAIGILGFLILWQLFSSSGLTVLPGPLDLFKDERTRNLLFYPFFDLGGLNKGLFWQTWASLQRVLIGYGLAAAVGISLGILIGVSSFAMKALNPIFQFLRMVPPLAWVPIALAAIQKNEPAALFVIFITAVWPILINTAVGVMQIPQDYINVRRVLQLSPQKFF